IFITLKLLLLDRDGMPQTRGGLPQLENAEAAVAIVDAQNRDPTQAEVGEHAACERIALHAIILERRQIPRNDGFGDGGVGGRAVYDRQLSLERYAQRDVRGIAAQRTQHGPDLLVVCHFDNLVARRSPGGLVVVNHQLENLAAVAAAGIGLFDGQCGALQHELSEALMRMVVDGAKESDADLIDVGRLKYHGIARARCIPPAWCSARNTAPCNARRAAYLRARRRRGAFRDGRAHRADERRRNTGAAPMQCRRRPMPQTSETAWLTPGRSFGTWRWLPSQPAGPDGRASPGCPLRQAAD